MDSKESQARVSWFKKWWHDWAKIDLTVLPIGIAIAYYLHAYSDGFWINLSTELIGAYISVRLIDYLLKKTEGKHQKRREVVGDIFWFYDNANRLSPHIDDWRVNDLLAEMVRFRKIWDERKELMDDDERQAVEEILAHQEVLLGNAKTFVAMEQHLEIVQREIADNLTDLPKWWFNLLDRFNIYRKSTINPREVISPILQKAQNELDKPGELSDDKGNIFREYIDRLNKLMDLRETIEQQVRELERYAQKLRNNIYQESS